MTLSFTCLPGWTLNNPGRSPTQAPSGRGRGRPLPQEGIQAGVSVAIMRANLPSQLVEEIIIPHNGPRCLWHGRIFINKKSRFQSNKSPYTLTHTRAHVLNPRTNVIYQSLSNPPPVPPPSLQMSPLYTLLWGSCPLTSRPHCQRVTGGSGCNLIMLSARSGQAQPIGPGKLICRGLVPVHGTALLQEEFSPVDHFVPLGAWAQNLL